MSSLDFRKVGKILNMVWLNSLAEAQFNLIPSSRGGIMMRECLCHVVGRLNHQC